MSIKKKLGALAAASAISIGSFIGLVNPAMAAPNATTLNVQDKPILDVNGGVVVKAMNNAPQSGVPVGDIPLKGFQFKVTWYKGYFNTAQEAQNSGKAGMSAVFETNDKGFFSIAKDAPVSGSWNRTDGVNDLPLGTLTIEEVKSVPGVDVNDVVGVSHIKLRDDNRSAYIEKVTGASSKPLSEDVQNAINVGNPNATKSGYDQKEEWKGGVEVTKIDEELGRSAPQGDGELAGAEFTIYNKSKASIWLNGLEKKPDDAITTIVVAKDEATNTFKASSGPILPYGTYNIKETKPGLGYLLNEKLDHTFTVRENGSLEKVLAPNGVPNTTETTEDILQGKMDDELNQYLNAGGSSSLVGAVFNLYNQSKHVVKFNGVEYQPGDLITTFATDNDNGGIFSAKVPGRLDYGTYKITEAQAPVGYTLNKDWSRTFSVREHDESIHFLDHDEALANQVKRYHLEFKKVNEENTDAMPGIAFKLTDKVTGESHIIVTDENGKFHTKALDPLHNTNANDPTAPNSNGAVKVVDGQWKVADESKLDAEAGLWFTGTAPNITKWDTATSYSVNNIKADAIVSEKAPLPYATYILEELRQPKNEGRQLYTGEIRLDKVGYKDGYNLDIDNIENRRMDIYTDTTYIAGENGEKNYNIAPAKENQTIVDEIMLDNFVNGKTYQFKGQLALFNKDGQFVKFIASSERTIKNKFQVTGPNDAIQMKFENVNLKGLEGHKLVAYQTVLQDGKVILEHNDPNDEAQTIWIPEIGTTAQGDIEHESNGYKEWIEIPDVVHYKNLEAGKEYTAKGTLMDKATGKPFLDADGKEITAETTFVAPGDQLSDIKTADDGQPLASGGGKGVSGDVTVTFRFKAPKDLPGKSVVAFEKVESDGIEWAVHANIEDEDQTIHFPKVETKASDPVDGNNEVAADKDVTVKDTVKLTNLTVGKTYDLKGTVHLKSEDGSKDEGTVGEPVTKQFTADKTEMEVEIEAKVDTSKLQGRDIVWFEELSRNGVLLGIHADITDEGQTIHIPKIGTKLATVDGLKEIQVGSQWKMPKEKGGEVTVEKINETEFKLIDTVSYENLTPGQKYTMKGDLHRVVTEEKMPETFWCAPPNPRAIPKDATPEEIAAIEKEMADELAAFEANGGCTPKPILEKVSGGVLTSNEVEFTPTEKNGTVDVEFNVTVKDLKDITLVAYEQLISHYNKVDQVVAKHEDPKDEGQTVNVVDIHTSFNDRNTESKQVEDTTNAELVDTVTYNNLVPGKSYKMCGTPMIKETNEPLKDENGKEIKNCTDFTPEKPNGVVEIVFNVNPKLIQGKSLVAFEDLSRDGKTVAIHHDITDEEQTVVISKVGTKLTTEGGKKTVRIPRKEPITLVDHIKYENLIPGKSYKFEGCLMNPATKSVAEGSKCVSKEITPEKANGEVKLEFTVDTKNFKDGSKVVAFEKVFDANGKLIGSHEDWNDKDQTVQFKTKKQLPKTGVAGFGLLALGLIAGAGTGGVLIRNSRKQK